MPETKTLTFSDTVKKIGKSSQGADYKVIFKRKAAFYSVEENNRSAIEALTTSFEQNLPVRITVDPLSLVILEASHFT